MKLAASSIKKLLPVWNSYKNWATEHGAILAGGHKVTPGQRLIFTRQGTKYDAVVIGLTGKEADHVVVAVIDPQFLRTTLYAVYEDDFGSKLGTKPAAIYKALALPPPNRRILAIKNMYQAMRDLSWHNATDGSLRTSDPDLFLTAHGYASGLLPSRVKAVLKDAYERANVAYHNDGTSFLSDGEFDRLREILDELKIKVADKATVTDRVGAAVKGVKEKLPSAMGSLDKVKSASEAQTWLKKVLKGGSGQAVATVKLDGISLQLRYERGRLTGAWTRGDGIEGKNVLGHLQSSTKVPKEIKASGVPPLLLVRAEAIMPVAVFEKKYRKSSSNPKGFENPRNMVAGVFNRNEADRKALGDIDVIAYEIMDTQIITKFGQLKFLKTFGFDVVPYEVIGPKAAGNSNLDQTLDMFRKLSRHEMDGLVLDVDDAKLRKALGTERNALNPAYARAFKPDSGDNRAATEVIDVEWNVSKHGMIKPVLIVKPVRLSGVTVTRATAFNAAYIRDNKIGPGAKVTLTRSGDVIPYIVSVDKPAKAALPSKAKFGEWDWNATGVDAVLVGEDNDDLKVQKMVHFFSAAGVENFSDGLIRRFHDAGHDIPSILAMQPAAMVKNIEGIQIVMAKKIRAEFDKRFADIPLYKLMYASGCFGRNFGSTKLKAIYNEYKDDAVLGWGGFKLGDIAAAIANLPGFSLETGQQFAAGIKPFLRFLKDTKGLLTIAKYQAVKKASAKLAGVTVVFTGFRDADLNDIIEANGGTISSGVSSKTTVLLVKSADTGSDKAKKARALGVDVMTAEQFRKKYNIG
jgi:DNA ligase (NAD+)